MIVKPAYSPKVKMGIAATIAGIVVLAGVGLYNYGLSSAGFERFLADRTAAGLKDKTSSLERENAQLREALARAERTLQMDKAAYDELNQSLKGSTAEITKLREDLNFYRNIISPPNKKGGLRIQSLNIEKGLEGHTYKYKLVLIQALKHDRLVVGKARFHITGLQAGKSTVLEIPESNAKSIGVNFRYFQDIEGEIKLPANFEPRSIKVNVTTRGRGATTVEETYNWPQA